MKLMGGRHPPPTTALDGWDEPADVSVVITVRLGKTFTWFLLGTSFSVPERSDFRHGTDVLYFLCSQRSLPVVHMPQG